MNMRNKKDISKLSANEYQDLVVKMLKKVFPNNEVKKEWNSATFDKIKTPRKKVYAPRTDVAIGPFNVHNNIKHINDQTSVMKNSLLVKRLNERYDIIWNDLSKCFLAIEVSFSGSSKHIMGDFLNATSIGAVGIVVSRGDSYKKADRIIQYLKKLEENKRIEKRLLRNLMLFNCDDFIQFLEDLYDPDRSNEFIVKEHYKINFISGLLRKSFLLDSNTFWNGLKMSDFYFKTLLIHGFKVKDLIRNYSLTFPVTKYTFPCTINFYEFIDSVLGEKVSVIDIIDIAVKDGYRSKGIGSAILDIIENIARDNNCKYILGELGNDSINEPLESQKRFFKRRGFDLKYDKRGEFSCWFAIKKL